MKLVCEAIIESEKEREMICDQLLRRFATSFVDYPAANSLYATYVGTEEGIANMLIQTFSKYPDHSITRDNSV